MQYTLLNQNYSYYHLAIFNFNKKTSRSPQLIGRKAKNLGVDIRHLHRYMSFFKMLGKPIPESLGQ